MLKIDVLGLRVVTWRSGESDMLRICVVCNSVGRVLRTTGTGHDIIFWLLAVQLTCASRSCALTCVVHVKQFYGMGEKVKDVACIRLVCTKGENQ
jgi:hypothetical protein